MQIISVFSGIGGFELAGEWVGWKPVVSCEINPFGRKVLEYYWPDAYHHDDVKTLTYEIIKEKSNYNESEPTIIVGGFPCQPYSAAGKRLGKEDDRHLWPEMLRIIREISPEWVVGENVLGLTNWNGGMVFDEVQADLESAGYEVQAYVLPACGVNAPHKRDRVWFVAHNKSKRRGEGFRSQTNDEKREIAERGQEWGSLRDDTGTGRIAGGITSDPVNNGYRFDGEQDKDPDSLQGEHRSALCSGMPDGTVGKHGIITDTDSNGYELRGFGEDRQTKGEGKGEQDKREWVRADNRRISEQGNVTNTIDQGLQGIKLNRASDQGIEQQQSSGSISQFCKDAPDTKRLRQQEPGQSVKSVHSTKSGYRKASWSYDDGRWPTQPPVCSRNDGVSPQLVGITFSKHRQESIKAYGNAIVPQVAYQIFKAINEYNSKQL